MFISPCRPSGGARRPPSGLSEPRGPRPRDQHLIGIACRLKILRDIHRPFLQRAPLEKYLEYSGLCRKQIFWFEQEHLSICQKRLILWTFASRRADTNMATPTNPFGISGPSVPVPVLPTLPPMLRQHGQAPGSGVS